MSVEIPRNDAGNTGLAESNQLITGVVSGKAFAASTYYDGKVMPPSTAYPARDAVTGLRH